jgi:hypothetical protein
VAQNSPGNTALLQLIDGDLASKSTIGLVKNVLRSDFDALAKVFAGQGEVDSWWGDDNLYNTSNVSRE